MAFQAVGRGFESRFPLQNLNSNIFNTYRQAAHEAVFLVFTTLNPCLFILRMVSIKPGTIGTITEASVLFYFPAVWMDVRVSLHEITWAAKYLSIHNNYS